MVSYKRFILILFIIISSISSITLLSNNMIDYTKNANFIPIYPKIIYSNTTVTFNCNCIYIIVHFLNLSLSKQYFPNNSKNTLHNFTILLFNHEENIKASFVYSNPYNNSLVIKKLNLILPTYLFYSYTLKHTNSSIGISLISNYSINGSYSIIDPDNYLPRLIINNTHTFNGTFLLSNNNISYQMLLYFQDKFNRSVSLSFIQQPISSNQYLKNSISIQFKCS